MKSKKQKLIRNMILVIIYLISCLLVFISVSADRETRTVKCYDARYNEITNNVCRDEYISNSTLRAFQPGILMLFMFSNLGLMFAVLARGAPK